MPPFQGLQGIRGERLNPQAHPIDASRDQGMGQFRRNGSQGWLQPSIHSWEATQSGRPVRRHASQKCCGSMVGVPPPKKIVSNTEPSGFAPFFEEPIAKLIDAIVLINQTVEIAVMAFVGTKRDVGVQTQGRMKRR